MKNIELFINISISLLCLLLVYRTIRNNTINYVIKSIAYVLLIGVSISLILMKEISILSYFILIITGVFLLLINSLANEFNQIIMLSKNRLLKINNRTTNLSSIFNSNFSTKNYYFSNFQNNLTNYHFRKINNVTNIKTLNKSETNIHFKQHNMENKKYYDEIVNSNERDILRVKEYKINEIEQLYKLNSSNVDKSSLEELRNLIEGKKLNSKIIWKGTSGKGENNVTYTGIFTLIHKILFYGNKKFEANERKIILKFIIENFIKYNKEEENNTSEISLNSLNGSYSGFNLKR